ncbi:hypothetical protein Bpfe_003476 [Biomphalaria pfeifferi]|uniref:Uncharacterized protein n=1 Tax=Biomphalaria pfeifferi TaxID=112525 RepID=A0AAD8FKF0_BIOPF|nr:hypothetical protein Bpfe_003476 [Biomphalaria pfeifferi]
MLASLRLSLLKTCLIIVVLQFLHYQKACCDDFNIHFLDFIREDGTSKCDKHFLTGDTLRIKAIVDKIPQDLDIFSIGFKFVLKIGKNNESLILFEYRKFSDCNGLNNSIAFSCSVSKEKAEAQLSVPATKDLSEMYLQLLLIDTLNRIYFIKEIKITSKIFDRTDITLTCNELKVGGNITVLPLPIDVSELTICCDKAPAPCYPVIASNTKSILNESLKCVTYKRKPEEKHFFIGFNVCGEPVKLPFEILISNETNSTQNGDESLLIGKIIGVVVGTVVLFIAIVFGFLCCIKKKRQLAPKKKENKNDEESNNIMLSRTGSANVSQNKENSTETSLINSDTGAK